MGKKRPIREYLFAPLAWAGLTFGAACDSLNDGANKRCSELDYIVNPPSCTLEEFCFDNPAHVWCDDEDNPNGNSNDGSNGGSNGGNGNGGNSNGSGSGSEPPQVFGPSPANGATNVRVNAFTHLDWEPAFGGSENNSAREYDVFFGTDSTPDEGEFLGTKNYSEWDSWLNLQHDTTYYWRVDAIGDGGITTGQVWNFRTESAPNGGGSGGDSGGSGEGSDGGNGGGLDGGDSGGNGGSSGGDSGGSGTLQTNFEPGNYVGMVKQDSKIYLGGSLDGTDTRSSAQSLTINSEGGLEHKVGDVIDRGGYESRVTNISVSPTGNTIKLFYDFELTAPDGYHISGDGEETYSFQPPDTIMLSGSLSASTTDRVPSWEQESTLVGSFVR